MRALNPEMSEPAWAALTSLVEHRLGPSQAIVLTGSWAVGGGGPHSDIDLLVIGDFKGFERFRWDWQGRRVEAMRGPWSWFEEVVTQFERTGNVGTVTDMVTHGRLLQGDPERWRLLQDTARNLWNRGPTPVTEDEGARLAERLRVLGANYLDAVTDTERRWLALTIAQEAVVVHFRLRGWWAAKPKYQWRLLVERDAAASTLVLDLLEQPLDSVRVGALIGFVTGHPLD